MNILKVAGTQLGIKEIKGEIDNPEIVKFAQETEITSITDDETPWCSTFVNWCAKESSLPMSFKANARSWMNVGVSTDSPEPGDIVVFWRESIHSWKGHVGIFVGFNSDASRVFCLGGNQSNAVTITDYDRKKVLGFRRLEQAQTLDIPEPLLKSGHKGIEVSKLQLALNHLSYSCGDVDGDFGGRTFSALRLLQSNNQLKIDGEYGPTSQACIESLLQT